MSISNNAGGQQPTFDELLFATIAGWSVEMEESFKEEEQQRKRFTQEMGATWAKATAQFNMKVEAAAGQRQKAGAAFTEQMREQHIQEAFQLKQLGSKADQDRLKSVQKVLKK